MAGCLHQEEIVSRQTDFKWFLDNKPKILEGHLGQSVVIRDSSILGYYPNDLEAYAAMQKEDPETYIIQPCLPDEQADLFYFTGVYSFS